jgi:quinol monooxygenase YgiN
MQHYGLHGHLQAQPGKGKELANILLQASQLVATAKGCRLYVISKDENTPDAVWITEIWDTKEDHDDSLKSPAVRELIGKAIPLLDGNPTTGQELKVLGGFGLNAD